MKTRDSMGIEPGHALVLSNIYQWSWAAPHGPTKPVLAQLQD